MPATSELESLENEIALLEAKLMELKRRRNALTPILRLPRELLVRIFSSVQGNSEAHNQDLWIVSPQKGWQQLMLICHAFRTIAVDTPTLWSIIDFSRGLPEWRDLCIARCATSPLVLLTSDEQGWNLMKYAQKAVCEFIRYTHIMADAYPNLRVFTLYLGPSADTEFHINSRFLRAAPITHLAVEGSRIWLDEAPCMPHLQRMILRRVNVHPDLKSITKFFEYAALLEDVTLEKLHLGRVLPSMIIHVSQQVRLSRLKALYITGTPPLASALARLLPVPSRSLALDIENADPPFSLNANHSLIYEFYMSFVRSDPSRTEFGTGSVTPDGGFGGTDMFHFGSHDWDHARACHYTTYGVVNEPHPLYNEVNKIFVHANAVSSSTLYTDKTAWDLLPVFPNLHTLVLRDIGAPAADTEDIYLRNIDYELAKIQIREMIDVLAGRVQRMEFESCAPQLESFVQGLQQSGVIREVIWS
jgi:hypothetical protein